MDKPLPETKEEIIQRLQKRLQAVELSYHDLLDNFDKRVRIEKKKEARRVRELKKKFKKIKDNTPDIKKLQKQIEKIHTIAGNYGTKFIS